MTIMKQGTVKFFNNEKGYGFITPDDSSKDVFVHSSGLIDNITEDDKVKFEVQEGSRGLSAVNVEVI
jgi:CspA family cold shock protein